MVAVEPRERRGSGFRARLDVRELEGAVELGRLAGDEPVRGQDLQPVVVAAHEGCEDVTGLLGSLLLVVGERRLVAMVAVGDEQTPLGAAERLCDRIVARNSARDGSSLRRASPPCPVRARESPARRPRGRERSGENFVRAARRSSRRASFCRSKVRSWGSTWPSEYGDELDTRDQAASPPRSPVQARERLLENPDCRLRLADEHALVLPGADQPGGLCGRLRVEEAHRVVRARRNESLAPVGRDDVVRRRDDRIQRPHRSRVVAKRPKRLQMRHDAARYHPSADLESPRDRRARRGSRGRRPVCRRAQAAPENAGWEPVSRARARGLERTDRRACLERRRSSRQALPGRRRGSRARAGGAVSRPAPARSTLARARGGRPRDARSRGAARRRGARRLLRVPRRGDLASRACALSSTASSAMRSFASGCARCRRRPIPITPIRAASSSTRWRWRR